MKKLFLLCAIVPSLWMSSCMKTDNYDGPNAALSGTVYDETTKEPFLTGPGEFSIRLLETSWSDNPAPQDLPVKQEGSYQNTKLFQATYTLQPYAGAFWPAAKVEDFKLGDKGTQDFNVVPYLKIKNVKWTLSADNKLSMSCTLEAPVVAGLPQVIEVRPFLSLTPYVGAGSRIDAYFKDEYRALINKNWSEIGDVNTGIGNETYHIDGLQLKSGYTYYVRMGAKVRDTFEKFNYSAIETIKVP
ncbi:DUF3823 domain-containing protein [Sphingobacterium sp. Mn56C]|uniref:DUF3823 domain-containing protein n=1 Tax=Sphingobacterium sp. Mn56C TaxID=3395261 RepID=UPI003BBA112A